jgi:hypothetical protein
LTPFPAAEAGGFLSSYARESPRGSRSVARRGDGWSELVQKAGVSMLTLQRWSTPPSNRPVRLRRVEVAEPAHVEQTIVLMSPTGLRIEVSQTPT